MFPSNLMDNLIDSSLDKLADESSNAPVELHLYFAADGRKRTLGRWLWHRPDKRWRRQGAWCLGFLLQTMTSVVGNHGCETYRFSSSQLLQ